MESFFKKADLEDKLARFPRYQDYVIRDNQLIGEFEQMYQDHSDPWNQTETEAFASEKAVCANLIESMGFQRVLEFGCGYGLLTNRISKACPNVLGLDISATAIERAKSKFPNLKFQVGEFPAIDLLERLQPDCIVMAEITWYVLDHLDTFLEYLKNRMPNTYLIHLLMTYAEGEQTYGVGKFKDLIGIKNYFGMNYLESGEVQRLAHNGGKRTYFIGRYASVVGS
jgi:SAM-dependent methyltransferase